jgi:hypothetical protein
VRPLPKNIKVKEANDINSNNERNNDNEHQENIKPGKKAKRALTARNHAEPVATFNRWRSGSRGRAANQGYWEYQEETKDNTDPVPPAYSSLRTIFDKGDIAG